MPNFSLVKSKVMMTKEKPGILLKQQTLYFQKIPSLVFSIEWTSGIQSNNKNQ